MRTQVIVDTGPLVAALDANDQHHAWTVDQLCRTSVPMLTCESVAAEAFFLLRILDGGPEKLWGVLNSGAVQIAFSLPAERERVCELMRKYRDLPMSLADACLVRMSELFPKHRILTLDGHFVVYRRNRNEAIPVTMPPAC
jgi:predicted nucleic acid-binding protein